MQNGEGPAPVLDDLQALETTRATLLIQVNRRLDVVLSPTGPAGKRIRLLDEIQKLRSENTQALHQIIASQNLTAICEISGDEIDLEGGEFTAPADADPFMGSGKRLVLPIQTAGPFEWRTVNVPDQWPQMHLAHGSKLCNGTLHLPNDSQLVLAGSCTLTDIIIHGSNSELVCSGSGASVVLQRVQLHGCSVVAVGGSAAEVKMIDCEVKHARVGVFVEGLGVKVEVTGKCSLEECVHGVTVRGANASVVLKDCHILNSKEAGVWAGKGARVSMKDCSVARVEAGHAVSVYGRRNSEGIRFQAHGCEFLDAQTAGVDLWGGADAAFRSCTISGTAEGHGVQLKEAGTLVHLEECTIAHNKRSGVLVQAGASAKLQDCDVISSEGSGLEARGPQTCASVHSCHFGENSVAAVLVAQLAKVDLYDGCTTSGPFGHKCAEYEGATLHIHPANAPEGQPIDT